jgi:hypothetical protein
MQIRVTSVAAEDVAETARDVAGWLERSLIPIFADKTFGEVQQFIIVLVLADTEAAENEKYCDEHNDRGSYQNPFTGKTTNYISLALPFDPASVLEMNFENFRCAVCDALLSKIESLVDTFPENLDFPQFLTDLRIALEILKRANYEDRSKR